MTNVEISRRIANVQNKLRLRKKTIYNGMSRSAESMRLIPLIACCVFKVTQLYHHRHPSDTELHTGDQ